VNWLAEFLARKGGRVKEQEHSFLHRIFFGNRTAPSGSRTSSRTFCYRAGNGAHLRNALGDEYVRRNASPEETQQLPDNPRLVQTAHEKMRDDFSSGRLDPKTTPNTAK
jgi:hypothetical protein